MGKNKDNKDGFLLYKSMYGAISWLSNEKLGELTRAIFEWQISNGESCNAESPEVKAALQFFINQFNIDNSKYQQTCESNRNNINKRWDKDTSLCHKKRGSGVPRHRLRFHPRQSFCPGQVQQSFQSVLPYLP